MIEKIPLFVKTIFFVIILLFLTHKLELYLLDIFWFCEDDGGAKIGLYSGVLTLIGIFYGVYQLQSQTKDSLLSNEYLNQPDFEFIDFQKTKNGYELLEKNGYPKCCCDDNGKCTNDCNDDHWFNIKQIGNLPLKDLKISIFHEKENISINDKGRIVMIPILNKNQISQYKLPTEIINKEYFDNDKNGQFYVLISYTSIYSNVKYKRIYSLSYTPDKNQKKNFKGGFWGESICFFSVSLYRMTDNNSITYKNLIIGLKDYLKIKLRIEKIYTKEKWLNKF